MSITSTEPTSRRGYLSQGELAQYADITITDTTEADDQIGHAEELIDSYVGFQTKFYKYSLDGMASAGGSASITLQGDHQNINEANYFKGMEVEIIGGTGIGQRRKITASTKAGVLTTDSFTTSPDNTSVYTIYQVGKFPRDTDVFYDSVNSPYTYYKRIPEAIKRAVAAQVEFIIKMGTSYFSTDKVNIGSETIGDYSYKKAGDGSSSSLNDLIAPKAKMLLRGIKNIKGTIVV
jgi:hypothetical protein